MRNFRRIGVLTSGGDAPGMNAAVRAVTRYALAGGVEVFGVYEGYKGLMEGNMRLFNERDVSNIISRGGTVLYSARSDEFRTEEGLQKAIKTCRDNNIDGIVAIGGDGTFRGATDLTARGLPCIGIPGTIDNDITATEYTIGCDTAMNTTLEMVDRLRDTCESHARCNVVEVMGRNAGYIPLHAGLAVGASAILIPEIRFDEDEVIEKLMVSKEYGKRNFIILISEGLGNYGEGLSRRIEERTGIETRFARLAHVVRGGSPTLRDREIASEMGVEAVKLLLAGKSNRVVCMRNNKIVDINIAYALTLDRMYKGKLKPEELEPYSEKEIKEMRDYCAKKRAEMERFYKINLDICK
ncbi:MAG: 6-phosphofructokinase [Clostridia bacterium]|nr:6-phosphofructokinase [Clostridia bacterium]